jgi:DNA-binding protein HU-beta
VNKAQLIDAIVESSDLTKSMAGQALDAFIASVTKALAAGESVALVGFGNFSVKSRAARTGRNPKTGAPIQIAEAVIPIFKAGKILKDAVAQGSAAQVAEEALA